jgi:hypothetical protein
MTGRVKGFAPWRPQARTLELLEDIDAVLVEYRQHLPLTVRQIFYRLVGKGYPKTENFYESVQEKCARARRCGRIPFEHIRDDGVNRLGGETLAGCYHTPEEYFAQHDELYNLYQRSWHADQPAYVVVLCEASGMVPMLNRAVVCYRVPVASSSGFDSLTVKYDLFDHALTRYEEFKQRTVLLHLGDHDPSGWWIHQSMSEDLEAFCRDRPDAPDDLIELRRTALTPDQIRAYGIEPDIKPPSGDHAKEFISRGLEPAAQLEAIPPDTLSQIIRQAVESALDLEILKASRGRETEERAVVQAKLDTVNEALREAFGLVEEKERGPMSS